MEPLEVSLQEHPDFFSFLVNDLSLTDLVALAKTNKKFDQELKSRLREVAILHRTPFANSVEEIGLSLWESANHQLNNACKRGDLRMIEISLENDAVKVTKAGYEAAKNGHFDIMNQMLELGANPGEVAKGLAKRGYLEELTEFLGKYPMTNDYVKEIFIVVRAYNPERDVQFFPDIVNLKSYKIPKDLFKEYGVPENMWNYVVYKKKKIAAFHYMLSNIDVVVYDTDQRDYRRPTRFNDTAKELKIFKPVNSNL